MNLTFLSYMFCSSGAGKSGKEAVAQQKLDEAKAKPLEKKRADAETTAPGEARLLMKKVTEDKKVQKALVPKDAVEIKPSKADKPPAKEQTADGGEQSTIVKKDEDKKEAKIKPEKAKEKLFKSEPATEGREPPKDDAKQKPLQKEEKPHLTIEKTPGKQFPLAQIVINPT